MAFAELQSRHEHVSTLLASRNLTHLSTILENFGFLGTRESIRAVGKLCIIECLRDEGAAENDIAEFVSTMTLRLNSLVMINEAT